MLGRQTAVLCFGMIISGIVFSEATTMSRDEWYRELRSGVPELICKGFLKDEALSKQMHKKSIDYDKCMTLLPESFDKCQKELFPETPETIDAKGSETWGNKLGECIGKDFAIKYLI